jgi:hypothetical protein
VGQVLHVGEESGESWGKGYSCKPKCSWEDSGTMYHKGIGWEAVEWINLTQDMKAAGCY